MNSLSNPDLYLERASEPMTGVIYDSVYQSVLQPPVRGAVMGIDPGYQSGALNQ